MTTLVEKLSDVRDFRKILETTVKEIGENYSSEICQIILSNPLDNNFTSICEYQANPEDPKHDLPFTSFPLHLEGGGLGLLNVSRQNALETDEVNEIRITLANISEILRYAQINDLVQRDTFRSAFMSEISNLMSLPMGLGDALFMVVNILGKALASSRCIFICVDDSQSAWRSYEYFQRERVESAQDYGFPAKDSAIVSQTLLSAVPIVTLEGQPNSYKTPVQEEMEFIGVRSQLAVALRSSIAVHGAIILQQCESRHAWTRDEIDMVQGAADSVAEALAQLPDEKKEVEPIMRLYQHEVAESKPEGQLSAQERRRLLKGALGQSAIPKAQKSKKPGEDPPAPPPAPAKPVIDFAPEPLQAEPAPSYQEVQASQEAAAAQEAATWTYEAPAAVQMDWGASGQDAAAAGSTASAGAAPGPEWTQEPSGQEAWTDEQRWQAGGQQEPEAQDWQENWQEQAEASENNWQETPAPQEPDWAQYEQDAAVGSTEAVQESQSSQISDLASMLEQEAGQSAAQGASEPSTFKGVLGGLLGNQRAAAKGLDVWGIETTQEQPPTPDHSQSAASKPEQTPAAPAMPPAAAGASGAAAASSWGDLDSIPTPNSAPAQNSVPAVNQGTGSWGDLDAIPTPGKGKMPGLPQAAAAKEPQTAAASNESKWGNLNSIPSPGQPVQAKAQSKWGDLDAIPAAQEASPSRGPGSSWGDLDAIPSPGGANAGPARAGLGAMMMGKAKASAVTSGTGLGNSFHKGGVKPPAPPAFVEGPPIEIDDAAAEAKLKQILATSSPTSDFIFATPGLDMRLLGRIDGWVSQVEAKDKHVHGHARALAEYATAVARLFELDSETVNAIRLAAIVHDVGKLGLPQNILQKPEDELTDSELVMIMNHPIQGAKLIEGFPELQAIAPIVLAHHEEYDGNGYPEGLSGENIPLEARIIHACNSYVELVSDLVYRAGWPPAQAQNEMIKKAGSTYDPNVVEALIACISQGVVPEKIV